MSKLLGRESYHVRRKVADSERNRNPFDEGRRNLSDSARCRRERVPYA
jgi:hypothetical protein